jgi:benzoyl-CoA reductase/2-hydroxyglutaryl-CoA dehydratase subunit BcrC/BadD/HgdB
MNWTEYPGFKKLRFNTELKAFAGVMEMMLSCQERVKVSGKKVVAGSPLSPVEPVYAAGAIAYDPFSYETIFHAVANEKFDLINSAIETGLSPDFSPWNLISVGAVAARKNQVVIDGFSAICGCSDDQVKKGLQAMASATGAPLHFWEVPRWSPEFNGWAIDFIVKELKQLFAWLSARTGHKITDQSLVAAIKIGNLLRQDMIEITKLQRSSPAPLPPLEYYILQSTAGDYMIDGEALHRQLQSLINELRELGTRSGPDVQGESTKKLRIYWLGEDTQEYLIFNLLEDFGASLVGSDTRLSFYYELIPEPGNPVVNLAKWIWRMPCNLSTPDRMQLTMPHIKEQKPDAVIIHGNVGSRNLPGAERLVRDLIKDETGLPVLSLETSLPGTNVESVKSQIKGFVQANLH